jgi:putative oxidoreductase
MRQELQLFLIRVCAGLAFVPAAVPKLFAGVEARAQLAERLTQRGVPHALQMVLVAGLIELALCLTLTLGYGTRVAALIAASYLAVTMYVGPWPPALLWMLVCASFVIAGGGRWSVDGWLRRP